MRTLLILSLLLSAPALSVRAATPASSCGLALAPGTVQVSVSSGGRTREFSMFVPKAYDGQKRLPLIFDLHGAGGDGRVQSSTSDFARTAEEHGFMVAWPDGGGVIFSEPYVARYWLIPGVPSIDDRPVPADPPDERAFFADAIDLLTSGYCVDARRVYVAGFSSGARMSSLLACTMADRITAVAPVAGIRAGLHVAGDPSRPDPENCRPARAIPVITFHGTNDGNIPYGGRKDGPRQDYGIEAAVNRWVEVNDCQKIPTVEQLGTYVERRRYTGCRDKVVVEFNRIDAPVVFGGGHVWPGSPLEHAQPINATERIWEFFSQYSLERKN